MIQYIVEKAKTFLFGENGGLTHSQIENLGRRTPFSDYIRPKIYDPDTQAYICNDDTTGYIFECSSHVYSGDDVFKSLEGLFTLGLPKHSSIQFILHADPYINHILQNFRNAKNLSNDLCRRSIDNYIKYLQDGTKYGLEKCQDIPVRNFRLYVTVKLKNKDVGLEWEKIHTVKDLDKVLNDSKLLGTRDSILEILKGAKLSPRPMDPENLVRTLARIFNDDDFDDVQRMYNPEIPINKQVIMADTLIKKHAKYLDIGKKCFMCLTPKNPPFQSFPLLLNYVLGGIRGTEDDSNQIHQPFLFAVNIFMDEKINMTTEAKCNLALVQRGIGSFALSHEKKKSEFIDLTDQIHRGTPLVRVIPMLWVYGTDHRRVIEAFERAKRLFQQYGFVMQKEMLILPLLLIDSLPMGFNGSPEYVNFVERYRTMPPPATTHFLPIQSDFQGGAQPALLFTGRKGQVIRYDIFDKSSAIPPPNYNFLCLAESGSGKSLLLQYIILMYHLQGAYIRVIDLGHSYRKLCDILGGTYLSFGPDSGIVINPFSNVKESEIDNDIAMISSIVQQMVFCSSKSEPDINAMSLIKNACRWAYAQNGSDAAINDVYYYLSRYPQNVSENDLIRESNSSALLTHLTMMAQSLAFNLREFTSEGAYGKFFNGRSNLNIAEDPFVVTDIQELKSMPDLFSVVTMQILNAITYDTYSSKDSSKRLILFDEAYQFLDPAYAHSLNTTLMSSVISEGFRRARKRDASFSIITQSVLDLGKFGPVGDVLFGNSATKFYLAGQDYDKAKNEKWLDVHPFIFDIIKSLKTPRPKYSEIFISSPLGQGVARLVLDPFLYYLFTSDSTENKMINSFVDQGYSFADAIEEIIKNTSSKKPSQVSDEEKVNENEGKSCVNY